MFTDKWTIDCRQILISFLNVVRWDHVFSVKEELCSSSETSWQNVKDMLSHQRVVDVSDNRRNTSIYSFDVTLNIAMYAAVDLVMNKVTELFGSTYAEDNSTVEVTEQWLLQLLHDIRSLPPTVLDIMPPLPSTLRGKEGNSADGTASHIDVVMKYWTAVLKRFSMFILKRKI